MACDPDFADVVLLMPCSGANGSTSFPDLSPVNNVMTAQDVAAISNAQQLFGENNLGLPGGAAAFVNTPMKPALADLAAGDFTVEGWCNAADIGGARVLVSTRNSTNDNGFEITLNGSTQILRCQNYGPGGGANQGAAAFTANTWHHFAAVQSGNLLTVYFDGVGTIPGAVSPPLSTMTQELEIGAGFFSSILGNAWFGWLSNIRITKGLARYTSDFTPSAEPFGVACPHTVIVPDVVGDEEATGVAEIEYVGLIVGTATTQRSDTVPAGDIVSQDPISGTEVELGSAVNIVVSTGPVICTSVPFEGYIAWPYLDFGILGIDKMMEGFDVVANGTFRVSFGYSQRDFSLATPDYALDGDTLVGGMVPMPLTAPSFQLRLTFDGEQAWEWFASNLYINNEGPG